MELFIRFAQGKMPFFLRPFGKEDAVFMFNQSPTSNSTFEIELQVMPFIAVQNDWMNLCGQAINLGEVKTFWPKSTTLKSNDTSSTPQEIYESYVARSVEVLKEGYLKKIVAARRVRFNAVHPTAKVFQALCQQYPNANIFAWWNEDSCWMGASPELLLDTIKNSSGDLMYSTDALAGTQVASSNKDLSRSWTAKEVEEHQLVTDGIVNDLTTYGATKIAPSPLTNKRAGHLFHRFQSISFQTKKPQGILDCLHPTAALCGLSREEARQWIIDYEGEARKFYGGYFALRQNKAYYAWVNLRSAEFFDNCTVLHVGAGLTKDSSPQEEWLETKEKTQTMLNVLHS
ncbi:MAG TPA: hypothetical protein DCF84_06520 [Bacteroidetes bacterium]|nr:hypothetical protein [Bacteroidota bacterium]